jgi:NitT/TauT family transport system substrate-binding protein
MKKTLTLLFCTLTLLLTACAAETTQLESQPTTEQQTTEETKIEEPTTESSTAEEQQSTEPQTPSQDVDVNITALKGPTAMGMVYLMSLADTGENNYNFEIALSIDEVTPAIIQGKTDIAAVPANVASVLYNNTEGEIQTLAINTLGVLYIVQSGTPTITSVADLKDKTIYASGKGATPEYALNYILSENGINPETDVTIEWKSEHAECLSALLAEDNAIALLPQPFVTTAQTKSDNINIVLDLTKEWDNLQKDTATPSALLTGVVVARTEFIEQNPKAVSLFLDNYKASVDYVTNNQAEAAALIGEYDIVTEQIALKALPYCNITFIEGEEMKEKLSGYLNVLYEQNPTSIGGNLPTDDFYYIR